MGLDIVNLDEVQSDLSVPRTCIVACTCNCALSKLDRKKNGIDICEV